MDDEARAQRDAERFIKEAVERRIAGAPPPVVAPPLPLPLPRADAGPAGVGRGVEHEDIPSIAVWLVPAGLALLALAQLPYGFYMLLRLGVCLPCLYLAWWEHERSGKTGWMFGLVGVALLLNPFLPVHLTRPIWAPVDVAVTVFLVAHAVAARKRAA
jgi:hypothetical protein